MKEKDEADTNYWKLFAIVFIVDALVIAGVWAAAYFGKI